MVLDPRIPDGLAQLRASWTLDDLVHAHQMLDQLDEIERRREQARGMVTRGR